MQNIKYPFKVELAGDSIWEYEGPQTVTVSGIDLYYVDEDYNGVPADAPNARLLDVHVTHDTDWRIYTDSGFERAISEELGFDVMFTEQGMQEDGLASMEEV
jgi:hypothetical protein